MGTFDAVIDIGDPLGQQFERLTALVDTGATYTVVPAPVLERLGVARYARERFELADGRGVEMDLGHTWVRIGDRAVITLVVFGDPETRTLLGAYTLEGVRLAPDPLHRRLVPVGALLFGCEVVPA